MQLSTLDLNCFAGFFLFVGYVAFRVSRNEKSATDYFLAGRSLSWFIVGISLIASNISTEHFVGMAGNGFRQGLAVASYEWMAAITLVIVAAAFLPRFLKAGIYTIPEYLEYRYSKASRMIMAIMMMITYNVVIMAAVLYSGALTMQTLFGWDLLFSIWLIGILSALYSVWGGMKSVAWSDMIQGIALLAGAVLVTALALNKAGGIQVFLAQNQDKLHTILPADDPEMPWPAVFIWGLWIPNIFYWGLNQFITQRTLGAKSLAEGQKGILLAATIKLIIPFIIVFPGIIAFQLFGNKIQNPDQAYPALLQEILPQGLRGIMLAALMGAVVSTLESLLNSASTIFTMDIYRHFVKTEAKNPKLIRIGRISTLVFTIIACIWAPVIAGFDGVFNYIQKFWGFITPGIFTLFVWGILSKKPSEIAALIIPFAGMIMYGILLLTLPDVAFLHHMGITFAILSLILFLASQIFPRKHHHPIPVPDQDFDMRPSPLTKYWGGGIILAVIALYVIFA